ncbi:MAG: hypothetical protein KGL19_02165, partial [Bacteroidota bacterium]|nr:hypothetical protein [Bacteroidota bacterium]
PGACITASNVIIDRIVIFLILLMVSLDANLANKYDVIAVRMRQFLWLNTNQLITLSFFAESPHGLREERKICFPLLSISNLLSQPLLS